jgi:putative chitinase
MNLDAGKFFQAYRSHFGPLIQEQVNGLNFLLESLQADTKLTVIRWAAYMFATTKHETADTFLPIIERGQRAYFNKYEPGTKIGKNLGNTVAGDGYLFRGRGYVQITGRSNYKNFSSITGVDLLANPEKALEPNIAYQIMSHGMRNGSFTGKGLGKYINDSGCDYVEARRIINGTDRASLIAGYAQKFESIFKEAIL